MSGLPEHNFPAFRDAARVLRLMGHDVTSPVEMDEASGFDEVAQTVAAGTPEWAQFLARDVIVIASDVEAVVVIDGWEQSRGAALEVHVARELGKPVYALERDPNGLHGTLALLKAPSQYQPPSDENVLEEAGRIVAGDRGDDYGHPRDDFARTAGAWSALFGWDVEPRQVALAMVVVKLSRLQETPLKRDSIVDIAGYARTYEMCLEREATGLLVRRAVPPSSATL
jgi:predicted Rossmann fold nucleotide-binding protein DprA/Smf involved in DNA uptake